MPAHEQPERSNDSWQVNEQHGQGAQNVKGDLTETTERISTASVAALLRSSSPGVPSPIDPADLDDPTLHRAPKPPVGASSASSTPAPTPAFGLPAQGADSGSSNAIPAPTVDPAGALNTYIGEPIHANEVASVARGAQRNVQRDADLIREKVEESAAAMHTLARQLEPLNEISSRWEDSDPMKRPVQEAFTAAQRADKNLSLIIQALARLSASIQLTDTTINALQSERERLATLYQIAQELNSELDLGELMGSVLAQLIEVVRAERGVLLLWDSSTGALRFMAARGVDGRLLDERSSGHSTNIVNQVWTTQQPLLTTDAQQDPRLSDVASVRVNEIRSVMCAPLRVRGHRVGVVYVDSRRTARLFNSASLDLLAAFCNQAAIAIDNARLVTDLRARIREISEMKTYMENIFASIASGVITTDTQGLITTFNRAAEHIFGVSGAQVVGLPYQRALATLSSDAATLADLLEVMRQAVVNRMVTLGKEFQPMAPGRGELALRLNVSPLQEVDAHGQTGAPLGVAMVVDDLTELRRSERQAREIRSLFGRYVHPEVVSYLLANPSAIHLGGETRQISVVFADIRNYTRLAGSYEPAEVVGILNQYLKVLTEAIWEEKGTITMFIGDALMAIFNAPLPQPDHAQRAVRAAWAMRLALARFHASQSLRALNGAAGTTNDPTDLRTQVEYGIGVHTGLALVGNIGARDRLQNYTAIGDAVNIAQRLQSNAHDNQIVLSAATYAQAHDCVIARQLEPLLVKGKTEPLTVYQLDGVRE